MTPSSLLPRWPILVAASGLGLSGVLLDRPIDLMEHPVRVSCLFGGVLPMLAAMAWGWRAGLAAGVLGLAAFYPFIAWPDNGWANVLTCAISASWFLLHGWAAERRRSPGARWWHSAYAVELVFDGFYVAYVLTLFRWSFALNPAPWAPQATGHLPLGVAGLIAAKAPINGMLVVLLADALLHLGPVRRLMVLPAGGERRYDSRIITVGAAASLALWCIDALVSTLVVPGACLRDELLAPDHHHLASRLILVALVLSGALAIAAIVRRRLRQDAELENGRTRHRRILAAAMDGFCLLDGEGRIMEANRAYADLIGRPLDRLVGMSITDIDADHDAAAVAARSAEIRRLGHARFESRHRRADGSLAAVEVSVQYHGGEDGCFVCFVRDIGERRRALEALDLERTLYKDLVAAMPAGVYRCTVHYASPLQADAWEQRVELNLVSDSFCRILGVTREACAADTAIVVGCIHPDDREEFARLNIRGQQELVPFNWEGRILRAGEVRWVHFASLPRRLEDGDVIWTGVLIDTSEHKLAVAARQRLEEQLRQREKMDAIGQLAGGVAHDFNNQLAGVMGYADLLEERVRDPVLRGYATGIITAARRAADLTQQLLAFARKGKYRSVPVDVHGLAAEVAGLLRRGIDKRVAVVLRLEAPRSLVLGDPSQLQNVLLNLGLNARDAMPAGGELAITTRVEEEPGAEGEAVPPCPRLAVVVSDTGTGMDAEAQRRLFEPFFTTKGVGKGTGLGLASAYGVVKNHGGAFRVRSAPGAGSSFTVLLPLGDVLPPSAVAASATAPAASGGRVLVVDDEPVVLASIGQQLRALGWQTILCGDPAEALEAFRREHRGIDLVVLDMVMPGMGGSELFQAMRGIDPGVRAVLASGYSLDGEAQAILDAGVRAFVQKPFDRTALARALAQAGA